MKKKKYNNLTDMLIKSTGYTNSKRPTKGTGTIVIRGKGNYSGGGKIK